MYSGVLDFHMKFCLHLTFPKQVTASYYNITHGYWIRKEDTEEQVTFLENYILHWTWTTERGWFQPLFVDTREETTRVYLTNQCYNCLSKQVFSYMYAATETLKHSNLNENNIIAQVFEGTSVMINLI